MGNTPAFLGMVLEAFMLNTRDQRLYRTAYSPGKSRLVPASSPSEVSEMPEEEIALAEHDNIADGDASLIETPETPEETPLAETPKRLEEDKASLAEMPAVAE